MTQQPQSDVQAQQFRCDNCGGVLLYEPTVKGLKCKHCKSNGNPQLLAPMPGMGVREIPLAEGLARPHRGMGVQLETISCNECGAQVNMQPGERSTSCVYCASPTVVTVQASDGLITPESLIPFTVAQGTATDKFKAWLSGLWFRPNDLSKMARLEQIYGVYVPYWTFDADVFSRWTAERGYYYKETETYTEYENGQAVTKTREVTKTRWEPAWGQRRDHHDDTLVCGSKGVPGDLADKLCTFQTSLLVPYSPGYLCGWRAEAYAIDLPNAWQRGMQKMAAEQERRCAGDVGGDTHRGLSVQNDFSHETYKHILLPIYVAAYRYKEKPYQVLVNGQTGEVVGKAPYSFFKIFFTVLAVLAVLAGIYFLTQQNKGGGGRPAATTPAATAPAKAPPTKAPGKK